MCVDETSSDDEEVLSALRLLTLTEKATLDSVYVTLLAWYILEEAFVDYEDEW